MTKRLDQLEALFKALADRTRLRILGLLLNGEVCVCHIHETLKIPQPKASRHLAYLRRCGLVDTRRDGPWIHYRLSEVSDPVLAVLAGAVRHALTHVDVVQRDTARLPNDAVCRTSAATTEPGVRCCDAQPIALPLPRSRR